MTLSYQGYRVRATAPSTPGEARRNIKGVERTIQGYYVFKTLIDTDVAVQHHASNGTE